MSAEAAGKLYALTILGYRKEGMSEKDYHDYVSERHAPCLRELLSKNGIVDYTIVRRSYIHSKYIHAHWQHTHYDLLEI
jgi:hypothetical protein